MYPDLFNSCCSLGALRRKDRQYCAALLRPSWCSWCLCVSVAITTIIIALITVISMVTIWVVVKIMVPFWVLIIIRHLIFRVPKKGP